MKEKTQRETSDRRWIAVSGLVFVAAWIVGLALPLPPAATASTADLVAYYQAHRYLAMLQTYLANGLTGITLIVFAAALRSALRRFEGESSTLSNIIFGAGLVVASLSCLEALFAQVLANHIAVTRDAVVIRTLLDLNVEIDTFKLFVLGIMIGMTSLRAISLRMALYSSMRRLASVWKGFAETGSSPNGNQRAEGDGCLRLALEATHNGLHRLPVPLR